VSGGTQGDEGAPLLLESRVGDGVLVLTLNRPARKNALNAELVAKLREALRHAAADPEIHVLVVRGAGPDFCSGADLSELERMGGQGVEASLADAERLGALFIEMRGHRCAIVAGVRGRALAGGAGLALACDMVLAEPGARIGFPEVYLGFVPAMVMTILRRKVGESRAFELSVTGDPVSAPTAHELGLVNRILPAEGFEEGVLEAARELARRPPSAVQLTKRLLYGLDGMSFEEGIARGAEVNVLARQTEACRAGVRGFLARAEKGEKGAS
jgi:methylglutaconyl-CoA hydratase